MSMGAQTVGFVTVTQTGAPGPLGIREKTRSLTLVHGVQFWLMETSEADEQTNVVTEVWRLIADPDAAAIAAKSTGEIVYDGTPTPADVEASRFRIDGANKPRTDGTGTVHHVTLMCKRQVG